MDLDWVMFNFFAVLSIVKGDELSLEHHMTSFHYTRLMKDMDPK